MNSAYLILSIFLFCGPILAGQGVQSTPKPQAQPDLSPKTTEVNALVPSTPMVDFGKQGIQTTSAPQYVDVKNTGKSGLLIKQVTVGSKEFVLTHNCRTHRPLPAGESCEIMVVFAPNEAGLRKDSIRILVPDAAPLEIALSGSAVESTVALSDNHFVFRDQLVGTRGDMQLLRVDNRGTALLSIRKITVSGGFVLLPSQDQCVSKSTVAPGKGCNLAVYFSPVQDGLLNGLLTIEDSDGATPHTVGLTGRATTVKLSVSSLVWKSPTAVGSSGATQDVQISNEGNSPLRVNGVDARGDFAQHNACAKELASHQSCVVSVVFQPRSVGQLTGSVKIHDSDVTAIQTIFLNGTGVPLEIAPAQIDFGEEKLESASSSQTVVLTNHGSATVSLRSIGVHGDFVMPSKSCGDTLAPGQSCKVTLSFSPTATGPRTGQLSVDAGGVQNIDLSGVGLQQPAKPQ
jgi:hypothetical protein